MSALLRAGGIAAALATCAGCAAQVAPGPGVPPELVAGANQAAERIAATSARTSDVGWQRLTELVDRYGARITGSAALTGATEWAEGRMREDGLDAVRLEPVQVPHWVRGAEWGRVIRPVDQPLVLLGLGGSVGTGGTLRAPMVAFESMDGLRTSPDRLDGKIAFVNQQMPPYDEERDSPGYAQGVEVRLHAASEAARRGAVAALVRSVTAVSLRTPHTGALRYEPGVRKIPAAAVTIEDADLLARLAREGPVKIALSLGARTLPDAPSANVVGEVAGRTHPDEIVVLGAHLDSWDVGPGASDDAAGCIAVMEAMRLLRDAQLEPRRTVRAVLFTGEEYLLAGSRAYAELHRKDRHVAAFETDYGMGAPDAIGVGSEERLEELAPFLPVFAQFGIRRFQPRAFGADVKPLLDAGAHGFDLEPDGRHYFDVHHSAADTLDVVRPEDLRRNSAAIALLAYLIASI